MVQVAVVTAAGRRTDGVADLVILSVATRGAVEVSTAFKIGTQAHVDVREPS